MAEGFLGEEGGGGAAQEGEEVEGAFGGAGFVFDRGAFVKAIGCESDPVDQQQVGEEVGHERADL